MKHYHEIILRPVDTEKCRHQREDLHQFVFEVAPDANKIEIKYAVERFFDVDVLGVQVMNRRGKFRRVGRRMGKRPNRRRAVVTLKEGQTIKLFEGV